MSFYYNAQWQPRMGGVDVAAGYSSPYDPEDFTDAQLKNAQRAAYGIRALLLVPSVIQNLNPVAKKEAEAIITLASKLNTKSDTGTVFDVTGSSRDADAIYNDYSLLYDFAERAQNSPAMVGEWKKAMANFPSAAVFDSMDELSDALSQAYEDFFNAYYDEDAGKAAQEKVRQQPSLLNDPLFAATPEVVVPTTPSATGKPRKPAIKKPTPKRASSAMPILLGAAFVVGGLLLWNAYRR